jgi:hypothetical protein
MVVLPLGYFVDRHMYPAQVAEFLKYRFAGSAAMLPLLGFVLHPMGRRFHRVIGVVLAMIPAGCMAWIIRFTTDPAASPYYAGLNLVLLAVGLVLHWTTIQSASAVAGVILLYVTACAQAVHETNGGTFINNLYFNSGDRGGGRAFLGVTHLRLYIAVQFDDTFLPDHFTLHDRSTGLTIIVIPREAPIATGALHTTLVLDLILGLIDKCLGIIFGDIFRDIGFKITGRIASDGPTSTHRPVGQHHLNTREHFGFPFLIGRHNNTIGFD